MSTRRGLMRSQAQPLCPTGGPPPQAREGKRRPYGISPPRFSAASVEIPPHRRSWREALLTSCSGEFCRRVSRSGGCTEAAAGRPCVKTLALVQTKSISALAVCTISYLEEENMILRPIAASFLRMLFISSTNEPFTPTVANVHMFFRCILLRCTIDVSQHWFSEHSETLPQNCGSALDINLSEASLKHCSCMT